MLVANPDKQKLTIQVKDSIGLTDITIGTGEVFFEFLFNGSNVFEHKKYAICCRISLYAAAQGGPDMHWCIDQWFSMSILGIFVCYARMIF